MTNYEPQSRLFKALAHPARLAILETLRDGEQCVCHIEAALNFRQSYISQQLSALRETGVVQMRREGWNIYYRVSEPRLFDILETMQKIAPASKNGSRKKPAPIKNCPCPKCNPAGSNC